MTSPPPHQPLSRDPWTDEGPQLITYADRFGGSLQRLHQLLDGPLQDAFGGVHVLPFFVPYDGADAGFDPATTPGRPAPGDWSDVAATRARARP